MQTINNQTAQRIKGDHRVIGRLMALFNKSFMTINRWIEAKDIRLVLPQALEIIKEETGLSRKEIIETESEASAA